MLRNRLCGFVLSTRQFYGFVLLIIWVVQREYISCPGCGRTLFDLQGVARRVREKTGNLPGVKIAIMGCIVNGPGEALQADIGIAGGKGKSILFEKGKIVKKLKNSDMEKELIRRTLAIADTMESL